jgi:hypothetical protein
MSMRGGAPGLIVEIYHIGTIVPGRGLVRETQPERNYERIEQARRSTLESRSRR